ncbi:hypothetical protein [Achromobacter aegrifaciens]|uniref:Uncharacterized protein n=1 Tax=Achromobacter aegrifaciens TaxID=1287736 RepID=A0ABU2DM06_ACHAE|nr:hypothetical protein [Achromobacter aegrifaciens]MDR7949072.1 hypothetical protein [Achromobacter aegrifaciens]
MSQIYAKDASWHKAGVHRRAGEIQRATHAANAGSHLAYLVSIFATAETSSIIHTERRLCTSYGFFGNTVDRPERHPRLPFEVAGL